MPYMKSQEFSRVENSTQIIIANLNLVTPEKAIEVTAGQMELLRPQIKQELANSGVNFEAIETEAMQANLRKFPLRSFDSGKGLAIVTATSLGFTNRYKEWAMSVSNTLPDLSQGDETSRSRGIMQVMANTIAFASGAITSEEYVSDLKWRVGGYYERPLTKKANRADKGSPKKETIKPVLSAVRRAYDIPLPGDASRDKYDKGYSRVHPQALNEFWPTLNRLVAGK